MVLTKSKKNLSGKEDILKDCPNLSSNVKLFCFGNLSFNVNFPALEVPNKEELNCQEN